MTASLKQWDNPAVRSATQDSDFDFSTLRKTPQSLYIAVSEDHIVTLETGRGQPEPEMLEREAAVPKEWEAALGRQEDFIEELLGG